MSATLPWTRWRNRAALTGAAGLLVWLCGTVIWHGAGFQAYWFAWVFWSGVGLGSVVLCFLQFLTRGAWSLSVQRPLEAGITTLPLMALLFLPVLPGMREVFPWVAPEFFHDAPHKRAYLTVPWFTVRMLACFGVLMPLVLRVRFWSAREDAGALLPDPAGRLRALSAGGLVVYTLGMMFASTDWVMSLEPAWFSTMFVVIFAIGQLLTALAGAIALVMLLPEEAGCAALFTTKLLRDLGNLLMAFVIFWTYVTFSQFLIIWSGNLPHEIGWYLHRSSPAWLTVTAALALLQFAVPFALLLSRKVKDRPRRLAKIALLVFGMNIVNVFWLVVPSFPGDHKRVACLCLPAFVGVGGMWVAAFLHVLQKRPLVPRLALDQIRKEAGHGS